MATGDKIKRKMLKTYIDTSFGGQLDAGYTLIGSGIEELTVEMGANVNKVTDVLGITDVYIDKYEKTQSITPFKCKEGDILFESLQAVIDGDLTLDDLNTNVVDVKTWETETAGEYPAIKELCVIEVVSVGGNTEGLQIPYNIHRTGEKTSGTFNPTTKTFTETV